MNFISETKFNAPIKGCLPSTQGNDKGDLKIDSNLALVGNLCEDGSFSISGDISVGHGIFVGTEMCNVTIGGKDGCATDYGLVSGRTADFNCGVFNVLEIGGGEQGDGVTIKGCDAGVGWNVKGGMADFQKLSVCSATLYGICSFNELAVFNNIRFTRHGGGLYDVNYWTIFNDNGTLKLNGSGSCGGKGGISIDSRQRGVHIDKLCAYAFEPDEITLKNEKITRWSDLTKYVGGGTETGNKIQRFTSPEVPANCSQFYFEGCNLVTGTELPFIQVRETSTGKLVQMDVWVNLDKACTAYTLGKPVAEVEPCSSVIEAGKWTAIVMN